MAKTTREIMAKTQTMVVEHMTKELARLPMKKAVRETLIDGAKDGMRMFLHHLIEMGVIEVGE